MGIEKGMEYAINDDLLISSQVANMLGVTRQRVHQMVVDRVLPPKYIFNRLSHRKLYLFDRAIVLQYSNKELRKRIEWRDPEGTTLMSVPDIIVLLECPKTWVYDMARRGNLKPDLVAGEEGKKLLYLYERKKIQKAWRKRSAQGGATGHRRSTVNMIKKIARLNAEGLSDSEIARQLGCKQPRVSKLRKEAGLISVCKRGRPSKRENMKMSDERVRV
jgi:predicted XRE-type DNA-binding protein